jgi:hypothetical protein
VAARTEVKDRRIAIAGDPQSLALSADGRRVACGLMDKTIRVWDLGSRRQLYVLSGHTARSAGMAFFPNGRRLVSASDDHTVRIFRLVGVWARAKMCSRSGGRMLLEQGDGVAAAIEPHPRHR